MIVWGINVWTLYGIGWVIGLLLFILFFLKWKQVEKMMKSNNSLLYIFSYFLGVFFSISLTAIFGFLIILNLLVPAPPEKIILSVSSLFTMWYISFGISFLFFLLTKYLSRKKFKDQSNKASIRLKELQKRQNEETKELTTK